jgi:hypothetical protein
MRVGLDSATKPHTAVAAAGMGRFKSITASQDADALCREWPLHRVASDSDGCLEHV